MERRKPRDCADITFKNVFGGPVVAVVLSIVLAGFFGMVYIMPGDEPEEANAYNELVTEFNALPEEQRELVYAVAKHEAATTFSGQMERDLMLELEDVPEKSKLDEWKELIPIVPIAILVLFFVAVVFFYWVKTDSSYYFCDLPLDTAYGWFLLLMLLPAGWPFLLVSWRRMRAVHNKRMENDYVKMMMRNNGELDEDLVRAEWHQILQMRSVARVSLAKRYKKASEQFVRIIIKARMRYDNGELWDFGDYEVRLYSDYFEINLLCPGTLTRCVDANYDGSFIEYYDCIKIETYIKQARMVEALTLIVDLLQTIKRWDKWEIRLFS